MIELRCSSWPAAIVGHGIRLGAGARIGGWLALAAAVLVVLAANILIPPSVPAHSDGELKISIHTVDDSSPYGSSVFTLLGPDGRPVTGLQPGQILVEDNGSTAKIAGLERALDANAGISLVVAIQTSTSMGPSLPQVREAARTLINSLSPRDEAAIVSFASAVKIEQPMTADRQALNAALDRLRAGGNTVLYDAVVASIDEASHAPQPRKIVVLLTDAGGVGQVSKATREEALRIASDAGVTVNALGYGTVVDQQFLADLAQATRGRALVAPTLADVTRAYADLAELLRSQYIVRFEPSPQTEQTERRLRIRVATAQGSGDATLAYQSKRPSAPLVATPAPVVQTLPQPVIVPVRTETEGSKNWAVLLLVAAAVMGVVAAWLLWRRVRKRSPDTPEPMRQDLQLARGQAAHVTADRTAILTMLSGPLSGHDYRVDGEVVTVGYRADCTVHLESDDNRRDGEHVRIWWRDQKLMLHHVGHRETARVSGRPVTWATLEAGDVIELGQHQLLVAVE